MHGIHTLFVRSLTMIEHLQQTSYDEQPQEAEEPMIEHGPGDH
jgi:hypothetical protein